MPAAVEYRPETRPRRSRARRVLGVIGAVVGTTVTFVTATAAAAVAHLDAAPTRRLVATQVNEILHEQLAGDVAIERIGSLGLHGVDGVRVRVKDPTGMQVLYVDGARVRIRALESARSFLFGKGDIAVPVDAVSIDDVDASIDGDAAGNLRLANAFAPRTPTPPKPKDPNARGVRVDAPNVALKHAWIHGVAPGAPPVDADLNGLEAHAHYDAKLTKADLDRVDLVTRGLPRGVDPKGRVAAHLAMPSATGQKMGVEAAFEGAIAGIPTSLQGHMDGQKIDAVLDGHDATGQGMRATFGEVGIQEEVTVHAEAHGELPKVAAKAHVALGRGTADLDANVDVSDGTKAVAQLAVRHVDAHAVVPSAPVTDVNLDTHAIVAIAKSGAMKGEVQLDTLPGRAAGEALPIAHVHADFTKETAHAVGHVVDPRATADFEANMTTVGTNPIVEGRLTSNVADFSRLPKVGANMKGHATITADGTVNLGTRSIDARAQVIGGGIAYGTNTVDDVNVLATAGGTMDRPVVDVGVHAGGLAAGEQKIGSADVRGKVAMANGVTNIHDAHVDIVREGVTVAATANRVQIGGARMSVDGAVITGLGQPIRADVSRDPQVVRIKLDAPSIDLHRVAVLAGKADAVTGGMLSMNGDVSLRRDVATGELHAKVDSLSTNKVQGAKGALDASFDGKSIGLNMNADLGESGRFELATSNVVIGGSPIEAKSWKRAHGRARFAGSVDMNRVASLFPKDQLPVSELRGLAVLTGVIRRDSGDVPPELAIHAHTRGLVIAGKAPGEPPHDVKHVEVVTGVQPWRSEGVDVSVDAKVDATSGFAECAFHAVDKKGTVVALDAKSMLPYREIVADPSKAQALLETSPISAKLYIPKRALVDMPQLVGTKSIPGTVEAELTVGGTALEPRVDFVAHARGVRSPSLPAKMATDGDVTFAYDGHKGDLVAVVGAEKHEALTMNAHVDLAARDLVHPTGEPLAWGGSAKVKMTSLPLDTLAPLADRRVRGHVSGEATLDDLHKDAKLHAQFAFDQLKIGRAVYKTGAVVVDARNGKVDANVRLEQTDGYANVHATTGLVWGAALVPSADPNANLEAKLDAKAFRAAAILPFATTVVNELDGRIDANATVKIGPGFKDPTLEGNIAYHDGTLQLVALGEEFTNARARITFQPGGLVKVDDVYMRGTDGELTADAQIRTRGFGFSVADASVHIPKRHPLDVSLQGQPYGGVSGDIKLAARSSEDGKQINVAVAVPTMNVTLPQKMKSGVQQLTEQDEEIRVGTFRDAKTFAKLPLDKDDTEPPPAEKPAAATTIDINVNLGDITVVQGNQARVVLTGNPHIKITNTTQVTGQVSVKEGKIDVQGKQFEIERATVTFQPDDTSNPIVVATAAWTAEDGSKIYADFVGPVKTGKVTLRSDPPRPRNEILAMILFGTADGANASPPPPGRAPDGTTKAATSLGGGYAAQGLTEAMDDLTGIQATARIDTSRSTNPAPEIEIQIARRISLAFEHILGTPPLSEPDTNLAIVDWRFRKNWSLETTLGDRGKVEVDGVWTKRY
jgi:translocation and assembly module TamB